MHVNSKQGNKNPRGCSQLSVGQQNKRTHTEETLSHSLPDARDDANRERFVFMSISPMRFLLHSRKGEHPDIFQEEGGGMDEKRLHKRSRTDKRKNAL